jgi:CO/xanthine dehydrogenase FAD-binding subunit
MIGSFEVLRPRHVEEVTSALLENGDRAALLAGGTDLLVRLKRSQRSLDVVVDLGGLAWLASIDEQSAGLRLGALATPAAIAGHPLVRRFFPGLHQAARLVGACQIRSMATVGGALCSGLRCQFRDQSRYWRETLGPCLAHGGAACHAVLCDVSVLGGNPFLEKGFSPGPPSRKTSEILSCEHPQMVPGSKSFEEGVRGRNFPATPEKSLPRVRDRCVATVACDLPPALAALGGIAEVVGADGTRSVPVESLYRDDGLRHLDLARGELVTGVLVPWPARTSLSTYAKARLRKAVDRPLVGVAVAADVGPDREIRAIRVAVCGSGPRVQVVEGLEPFIGARLDEPVAEAVGRAVHRAFHPSPALRIDPAWRRHCAGVLIRRSLEEVLQRSIDVTRSLSEMSGIDPRA